MGSAKVVAVRFKGCFEILGELVFGKRLACKTRGVDAVA